MGNVVLKGVSSKHTPELLQRIRENIPDPSTIIRQEVFNANCLYKDKGDSFRGNGALVLTHEQLWFSLIKPRKDLVIPLKNIISVESRPQLVTGNKTTKVPLVMITYQDDDLDSINSIAFHATDVHDWLEALQIASEKSRVM